MNQELKQRLIGAVVVTALAAIFIPMLFDDPINNSGQIVTELSIPPTPVNTGEVSANKLPTNATQVLNAQATSAENIVNTDEEAELSAETQAAQEAPLVDEPTHEASQASAQAFDEPVNDDSSNSLDTGVVNETNKPTKSGKVQPQTNLTKQQSAPEPEFKAVAEAEKPMPTKAPEKIKAPVSTEVISSNNVAAKPTKAKTEFSRWTIQAGSFSKKENATTLMDTLRKQGLPVTLDTINTANNTPLYRLKIGPTLDKKRATEMKAKLDNQKIQSLLIAE